jgi:hypothetical protein
MSTKMYVGVNNIARPVSKIYVGINNTAQLCYEAQAPAPTVPSWSTGTISEISTALQQAYAGQLDLSQYWHIGDERVVSCSAYNGIPAQDVVFVLANKGGKMLADGVTECQYVIVMKDMFSGSYSIPMNSSVTTSGGWNSCNMRSYWCNNYIPNNIIDSSFVQICKQHINRTSAGNGSSSITQSTDLFSLPSQVEVDGSYTKSYANEGTQLDYYKDANNRKKYRGTSYSTWWTRSCFNTKTTYNRKDGYYCYCNYNSSGNVNAEQCNSYRGISVMTVI